MEWQYELCRSAQLIHLTWQQIGLVLDTCQMMVGGDTNHGGQPTPFPWESIPYDRPPLVTPLAELVPYDV